MNKSYTIVNGNVVISDEYGNQTIRPYYNNTDEILVEENIIEILNEKIKDCEEEKEEIKDKFIPDFFLATLSVNALFPIFLTIFGSENVYKLTFNSIIGPVNLGALIQAIVGIPFITIGATISYHDYKDYKEGKKKKR